MPTAPRKLDDSPRDNSRRIINGFTSVMWGIALIFLANVFFWKNPFDPVRLCCAAPCCAIGCALLVIGFAFYRDDPLD
jgi:hypothetical protein